MLIKVRPKPKEEDFEQQIDNLNESQQQIISQQEEYLGFKSAEHFHVPALSRSNQFSQVLVQNQNKSVIVNLKTTTFPKVKRYIETPMLLPIQNQDRICCRICLEEDQINNLISPCSCIGSIAFVHKDCLQTWLLKQYSLDQIRQCKAQCELCKDYFISYIELRTKLQLSLLRQMPKNQLFWNSFFFVMALILLIIGISLTVLIDKNQTFKSLLIVCTCISFITSFAILMLLFILAYDNLFVEYVYNWIIKNRDLNDNSIQLKQIKPRRHNSMPKLECTIETQISNVIRIKSKQPQFQIQQQFQTLDLQQEIQQLQATIKTNHSF